MPTKPEPLFEALKRVGRTPAQHATDAVLGLVAFDWAFFKGAERELGTDKAKELHRNLWSHHLGPMIDLAKETTDIARVEKLSDLGRLMKSAYESIPCLYKILEDSPTRNVGVISLCPFLEYARGTFGEEPGSAYFQSRVGVERGYWNQAFAEFVGWGDRVRATQDKCMCLGDGECRIVFEMQP